MRSSSKAHIKYLRESLSLYKEQEKNRQRQTIKEQRLLEKQEKQRQQQELRLAAQKLAAKERELKLQREYEMLMERKEQEAKAREMARAVKLSKELAPVMVLDASDLGSSQETSTQESISPDFLTLSPTTRQLG